MRIVAQGIVRLDLGVPHVTVFLDHSLERVCSKQQEGMAIGEHPASACGDR
jgi:hypothetical protein